MIAAPKGSKLIFTILIHRRSPKDFQRNWEQRLERQYSDLVKRQRHRDEFAASFPPLHRYNDIAGFAEVYWDGGTRVLVDYFFRGDRSRKFGQQLSASYLNLADRLSPRQFYGFALGVESGGIPHRSCNATVKREAILEALENVGKRVFELGCFVNLTHEHELLDAMEVEAIFRASASLTD